jgi:hypothetical protein
MPSQPQANVGAATANAAEPAEKTTNDEAAARAYAATETHAAAPPANPPSTASTASTATSAPAPDATRDTSTPAAPSVAQTSVAATLTEPARPSNVPAAPFAVLSQTAAPGSAPAQPAKRARRADELLTEAFEATQDFAFVSEVSEACAITIQISHNLLDATGVAIMLYDIDRDELVLEAVDGVRGALGTRAPLATGPRGEAAIKNKLVLLSEPFPGDPLVSETPSGPVLYAPLRHDRRLFGVIQWHRGANELPFIADEQNAATYVAGQLAKFLSEHSKRIGFKDDDSGAATRQR